jgi:uncharacterized protein (DUF58 family)
VTARYNEAHVKVFEEERELTMMLWSIFQGRKVLALKANLKRYCYRDCRHHGFSATQNNDKIGLILFSDQIELYIPPKKGRSHVLRIIRELIEFEPKNLKTDIAQALKFLSSTQKRKRLYLLSLILWRSYEHTLKIAAKNMISQEFECMTFENKK